MSTSPTHERQPPPPSDSFVAAHESNNAVVEGNDVEQQWSQRERNERRESFDLTDEPTEPTPGQGKQHADLSTQVYTLSYLIFFSFFGTLARIGIEALTFYPGAPIIFTDIWANFGGCILMGLLNQDRELFKDLTHQQAHSGVKKSDTENGRNSVSASEAHIILKKKVPLYIGLSTGLCGCLTSFSSFMKSALLALSNTLAAPEQSDYTNLSTRNGGYSFMAMLAVVIGTVTVCMSGLFFGAHLAIAMRKFIPSVPQQFTQKYLNPLAVFISFGCWLGTVFLAIFPPDRNAPGGDVWRGRTVFALVFAPLGCLARYYVSFWLNGKRTSFPLGTFTVNVSGTALLGMFWDLQHVPLGGVVGCQILQGLMDGFCGSFTTISTWVTELSSLRLKHSYRYGGLSILVGLIFLILIMGTMKWTVGYQQLLCSV